MKNTGFLPRPHSRTTSATPTSRRPRSWLVGAIALGLVALAGATLLILVRNSGPDRPLVIDRPHAVLWGETVERTIEIAADDVTIRRVTVRVEGVPAIRVRPGVAGAVITDTQIHCTGGSTDGIVPGNYSAVRVSTRGCRQSFAQHADPSTLVVDSEQDGQPYWTGRPVGSAMVPDPSGSPEAPLPPRTRPPLTGPNSLTSWPGPATTGVPAGTQLTDSGPLDLRRAGQVVANLRVNGCVTVRAANVTIRSSKINCNLPGYAIRGADTATNLVVEDVEIDGGGRAATAVCCGNYTLRRVNIHHTVDGPRLGSRSTVVDSWIHDLVRIPSSHNDALEIGAGSGMTVRHNRIDAYKASTNDPMNSCLMIGSTSEDAVRDLLVEQNYCNGGNYSIGIRPDVVAANVVIRNNTFGRDHRYGILARYAQSGIAWDRATNTWFDTGEAVRP